MYTILVASLNENVKLANTLKDQLSILGKESNIVNLVELNLALYSSKEEEENGIPSAILDLVQTLDTSRGYIVVAPEYNFTTPAVLANAITWITRVNEDYKTYYNDKVILLATHSGGGGKDLLRDMRNQFTKLGAVVFNLDIHTTYQAPLNKENSMQTLENFTAN